MDTLKLKIKLIRLIAIIYIFYACYALANSISMGVVFLTRGSEMQNALPSSEIPSIFLEILQQIFTGLSLLIGCIGLWRLRKWGKFMVMLIIGINLFLAIKAIIKIGFMPFNLIFIGLFIVTFFMLAAVKVTQRKTDSGLVE